MFFPSDFYNLVVNFSVGSTYKRAMGQVYLKIRLGKGADLHRAAGEVNVTIKL